MIKKAVCTVLTGIAGFVIITGLLYAVGYRITGPAGKDAGLAKQTPGWRRSQTTETAPGEAGSGQGRQGRRQVMAGEESVGPPGGSQQGEGGKRGGGGQGGRGGRGQGGASQSVEISPLQLGTTSVPILVTGKQKASFTGKEINKKVEDTTIATLKGVRRTWSVHNTLKFVGLENVKEVVVTDRQGKTLSLSSQQVSDQQTVVAFTYDENGNLLLVSGPKVRGVGRRQTSQEQIAQMMKGRKDLLFLPNIVKIEIKIS